MACLADFECFPIWYYTYYIDIIYIYGCIYIYISYIDTISYIYTMIIDEHR